MPGPYVDGDALYYYDSCAAGLICAPSGGPDRTCQKRCASTRDCAAGQLCFSLGEVAAGVGLVGTCRAPQGCDPTTGGGGCRGTLRCKLLPTTDGDFAPACAATGTPEIDEGCSLVGCADGLTCLRPLTASGTPDLTSEDLRCRQVCDPAATPTGCPTGATCRAVSAMSGASLGFCELTDPMPVGGGRPARVVVPPSYDGTTPLPLVIALHGQGGDPSSLDGTFRLSHAARTDGYFLVLPIGTRDSHEVAFWNATPACCDVDHTGVDDSTYVASLIAEMKTRYHVDATHVYVVGYSNGGFMAYRTACDHADVVSAVASFAGSTFDMESDCHASRPISVLEVHGDMDFNVDYSGSTTAPNVFPGAVATVERWATRAGCDVSMGTDDPTTIDLDKDVTGAETTVRRYTAGCMAGLDAQLWTMHGSNHFFTPQDDFMTRVDAWMLPHAR
jgi:polyhydroxybutyrate depolymerase